MRRSEAVPRWVVAAFLLFAFIGFTDATYLAAKHYLGTPLACSVFANCEKVTSSRFAVILGIPLGVYGALYYLAVILLTIGYVDTKKSIVLRAAAGITPLGFLASAWFVYLQLFVIGAVCPYCMLSALMSTLLLIPGLYVLTRGSTGRVGPS
jgi:uncharacterized membrane protein